MSAVSVSMGKFVAGITIAILVSSAISIGASTMLAVGPQGEIGPQGYDGPQGIQGPEGPKGDTGDTGPQGVKGDKGDIGDIGPRGEQGPQGLQGERGFGLPQQGNISVSYSAFTTVDTDAMEVYYNPGFGLYRRVGGGAFSCMAQVQLPHGTIITNATFYFYDNEEDFLEFFLIRENQTDYELLGAADSSPGVDTPGNDYVSLSTIDYATVDNNNYHYYIYFNIPPTVESYLNYRFHYALVEYKFPS